MGEKPLEWSFQQHHVCAITSSYKWVMSFGSKDVGLRIVQLGFGKGKVIFSLPNYYISLLGN